MGYHIQLLDRDRRCVATADVDQSGPVLTGVADLRPMPPALRAVFERYETTVNGQVLAALDAIEDEIAAVGVTARFGDGRESALCDLQVFPTAGRLSFRLPTVP